MNRDLSRHLHAVTVRADRAADRILRAERGLSYSRFLALYAIDELGGGTQRALAEWLAVSEPSISRMVHTLQRDGLVSAPAEAGGNRRRVELTATGRALLDGCGALLEGRLAEAVAAAGVDYDQYRDATVRLLGAFAAEAPTAATTTAALA